jgi:protein-tyrosine phosphatase
MAEYLFKDLLGETTGWVITSAGTYTRDGLRTNFEVLAVLKSYGIDASAHRTRLITRRLIYTHNLVLCLAKNHKEALQAEFPDLKDRIFLLSEMVGAQESVEDPIGGPLIEYQVVAQEIKSYLTQGLDRILELAGE